MANARKAVDFVLRQEDGRLTGEVTQIPGDAGGLTRFGLTAKWHPELVAQGFFDPVKVPSWQALDMAEEAYEKIYEIPLCLDDIAHDDVATALLSFAVNDGNMLGVKLLQQAAGVLQDGKMGPQTVAAVNAEQDKTLVDAYCALQAAHYRALAKNPAQVKFLNGWMNRTTEVEALA